jgi:CubicO group peptidase (beta-lactamase class C family)
MTRLRSFPWLALLLCIGIAGCGSPDDGGAKPAAVPSGPAPIDLQTPLLPTLVVEGEPLPPAEERTLERQMAEQVVPGVSIAVIQDGAIVWAGGFGMADVESERPVTADTLFQAASISKPVAAMGALRLVQDGALDLDEDVNARLTSWQVPSNELTDPPGGGKRPVTLRGLLSHTAGLTVHGFPGYAREESIPSTVEVLDGEGNTDPVRVDIPPGSEQRYSGGGYTVVQQLMVDVTDESFPEVMEETVLGPLGMNDSTYEQPLPGSLHDRTATGYRSDGTPVEGLWHVYPEMAAAGLWTTPTDLARFAMAIQKGAAGLDSPAINAATVREMLTPHLGDSYGLGLSVTNGRFGHGGSNEGFRCTMTAFRVGGNGAVVMTNSDSGGGLGQQILMTLFDHYGWPGMEPTAKVVIDLGTDRLESYAGTYRIEGYGDVVLSVAESGDRLRFVLPDGGDGVLRPVTETEFFDPEEGQTVTFTVDESSGAASGFTGPGFEAKKVE